MAATPRKLVHWALDVSMSAFGSSFLEGSSTDSMSSTSSLQYINSQLVAHGYTTAPGLSLDALSNSDTEKVVKCILGMLSQRVDDMSRAEDLTTKFRTLSYDHERLMTMHRTANEKVANAEREMNLHKSRLAAANRSLQSSESAHKHTAAELQRTRTALQAIRLTHQSELKKKEKEIERMVDKWSKLADMQVKLGTTAPSGLQLCANGDVGVAEVVIGKGQGYLEIALEQAEKGRGELWEENAKLRRLVVNAVNDVQGVLHLARCLVSENQEEPTPITQTTLFPLHPPTAALDRLTALLTSLRESLTVLSHMATERVIPTSPPAVAQPKISDGEIERLQSTIDALRVEIDNAHKQSAAHAAETQALFAGIQEQPVMVRERDVGEVSVDLMITPVKDEERDKIDATKKGLDEERRKFTEAAVKLGKEKAALEAERIRFLDEKRSWQVEQMLAELPPTPAPSSNEPSSTPTKGLKPSVSDPGQYPTVFRKSSPHKSKSPRKSPRKSPPRQTVVGKAGAGRNIRVSRRSSTGLGLARGLEPAFETEVMPPAFPIAKVGTMPQSLLPTSFVLPPPSPHSSLPSAPASLSSTALPAPQQAASIEAEPRPLTSNAVVQLQPSPEALSPDTPPGIRRLYPMAKSYAPRMVHAYSPAKPSPLSRILMLNDSFASPPNPAMSMEDLVEEQEDSPTNNVATVFTKPNSKFASSNLAAGLRTEEIALREKNVESNVDNRLRAFENKRYSAKEKGKGKADPLSMTTTAKSRATGVVEKENQVKAKSVRITSSSSSGSVISTASNPKVKVTATSSDAKTLKTTVKSGSSGVSVTSMKLPPGKGGARRVPIDSAEAAPVGPGWRG